MTLSPAYDAALLYASALHREQSRRGMDVPYLTHLLTVSALVLEYGGDEKQAIAALLHDAVEDQGGETRLVDIRERFGGDVAQIVSDCTDAWADPRLDWRPRKEAYLASLPGKTARSLLVSLADKTHNAEAIVREYLEEGERTFKRFNGGAEGTRWYYQSLAKSFERHLAGSLCDRLHRAVRSFRGSA